MKGVLTALTLLLALTTTLAVEPGTITVRIDQEVIGNDYHVRDFTGEVATPEKEREIIAMLTSREYDAAIYVVQSRWTSTRRMMSWVRWPGRHPIRMWIRSS